MSGFQLELAFVALLSSLPVSVSEIGGIALAAGLGFSGSAGCSGSCALMRLTHRNAARTSANLFSIDCNLCLPFPTALQSHHPVAIVCCPPDVCRPEPLCN